MNPQRYAVTAMVVVMSMIVGLLPLRAADWSHEAQQAYEAGDYATALRLIRPPAEQGDANAQFKLGLMYQMGQGVAKNYDQAVKWYRVSATQGDADGQLHLGVMYFVGKSVATDYVEAHKWINIASINGNKKAGDVLRIVAKQMTPAQIVEAKKRARDWMAKHPRK